MPHNYVAKSAGADPMTISTCYFTIGGGSDTCWSDPLIVHYPGLMINQNSRTFEIFVGFPVLNVYPFIALVLTFCVWVSFFFFF